MGKKVWKIITIFILVIICMGVSSNISFAEDAADATEGNKKWSIDKFGGFDGVSTSTQTVVKSTRNVMGTIINTIKIVGTGVAIIMITYVAIKYMSAAPTEKAEFKKSATAYIVGAVVLFAASNILSVINNFATANIK